MFVSLSNIHLEIADHTAVLTLALIWREMASFVALRHVYLRRRDYRTTPQARTVLITNIPKDYMSHTALEKVFGALPGGIKTIWINRNFEDLPDLVQERDNAAYGLEAAETNWIKLQNTTMFKAENKAAKGKTADRDKINEAGQIVPTTKRPTHNVKKNFLPAFCYGRSVDSIDFYSSELERLNAMIVEKRLHHGDYVPHNSAFIEFNSQVAAYMAVQSLAHHTPNAMTPRYTAVHPEDVVWSNLNVNWLSRRIRQVSTLAFVIALVILWAIPVAFVGGLSQLTNLEAKIPALHVLDNVPVATGIIQGILPTVLLAVLMALLPIILRFTSYLEGIPTNTAIDLSLMNKYFFFLVVNVFFVTSIAGGAVAVIPQIAQNPSSAAGLLANNVPKVSTFFINYIMLQGFTTSASEIVRVVPLILYYVLGKFLDNTPRKVWNRTHIMSTPQWGTLFPQFTIITVIGLAYTIIAPIVVAFTTLAFGLFYFVYRHQFLYVYDCPKEMETGGRYFPRALYQTLTGVYIMEVVLIGLFFVAQNPDGKPSSLPQAILMIILLVFTAGFQILLQLTYDPLIEQLPIDVADQDFGEGVHANKIDQGVEVDDNQPIVDDDDDEKAAPPNGARQPESSPYATPMNELQVPPLETQRRRSSVSIFDSRPAINWFMHPCIYTPQPVVWLPNDSNGGVGAEAKELAALKAKKDVAVSDEGAVLSRQGKITVDSEPPELEQAPVAESVPGNEVHKHENILDKIPLQKVSEMAQAPLHKVSGIAQAPLHKVSIHRRSKAAGAGAQAERAEDEQGETAEKARRTRS